MEDKVLFKNWWLVLLKGIIFIGLGVLVFNRPEGAIMGVALWIGLGALFSGIAIFFAALSARNSYIGWGWYLVLGIFDIFIGIYLLSHPALTMMAVPFIFGFWLMFIGISLISSSFHLKKLEVPGTGWLLFGGIVTVLMAILVLFDPLGGMISLAYLIGFALFFYGISSIAMSFDLKKLGNQ